MFFILLKFIFNLNYKVITGNIHHNFEFWECSYEQIHILNSIFSRIETKTYRGGAISIIYPYSSCILYLTNSLFFKCTSLGAGGGIFFNSLNGNSHLLKTCFYQCNAENHLFFYFENINLQLNFTVLSNSEDIKTYCSIGLIKCNFFSNNFNLSNCKGYNPGILSDKSNLNFDFSYFEKIFSSNNNFLIFDHSICNFFFNNFLNINNISYFIDNFNISSIIFKNCILNDLKINFKYDPLNISFFNCFIQNINYFYYFSLITQCYSNSYSLKPLESFSCIETIKLDKTISKNLSERYIPPDGFYKLNFFQCIFLDISNSNFGGAIFISDLSFELFILETLFYNCSAFSNSKLIQGGAFFFDCIEGIVQLKKVCGINCFSNDAQLFSISISKGNFSSDHLTIFKCPQTQNNLFSNCFSMTLYRANLSNLNISYSNTFSGSFFIISSNESIFSYQLISNLNSTKSNKFYYNIYGKILKSIYIKNIIKSGFLFLCNANFNDCIFYQNQCSILFSTFFPISLINCISDDFSFTFNYIKTINCSFQTFYTLSYFFTDLSKNYCNPFLNLNEKTFFQKYKFYFLILFLIILILLIIDYQLRKKTLILVKESLLDNTEQMDFG